MLYYSSDKHHIILLHINEASSDLISVQSSSICVYKSTKKKK